MLLRTEYSCVTIRSGNEFNKSVHLLRFFCRAVLAVLPAARYLHAVSRKEASDLPLDDGTKKIFLNMTSKNGRPELISLLQYMKNTTLENPEITVRDNRIVTLDEIVKEVKQSEEWEAVKMNILEIGIEKGRQEGLEQGLKQGIYAMIQDNLEEGVEESRICAKLQKNFSLTREAAEEELRSFMKETIKKP